MTQAHLPVVVIGGGPAGATAALVLARAGQRVILLDAGGSAASPGESLPPAARPLLRDLGWLPAVTSAGHLRSVGTRALWGQATPAMTDHLFDPNGEGWLLDRRRFERDLRAGAAAAGVEVHCHAFVRAVERAGDAWQVEVRVNGTTKEQLTAQWLVDASGRRALVARAAGAIRQRDDRQMAYHARFTGPAATEDDDGCTTVEAVAEGWWYTLRVPGNCRVAAYITDADNPQRSLLRSSEGFRQALHATSLVRFYLEGHEIQGPPRLTEAGGAWLEPPAGARWTAVGDAALAFDPLSSQGLLTALYTGLRGGECVLASLHGDPQPARQHYIERLQTIRKAYLEHRALSYASEQRWRESSFWARRQQTLHVNHRIRPGGLK